MGYLESISAPRDLRDLTDDQLDVLATEIRDFLVATCSRTGGHLGPNLGVVELSDVFTIFNSPRHPYTVGLMNSLARVDIDKEALLPIPGQPPSMISPPPGCAFHPRCLHSRGRARCPTPQWRARCGRGRVGRRWWGCR